MSIFFCSNQEQRDYIWKKIRATYPEFRTGGDFYRDFLKRHLHADAVVLDAGCGDGGILAEFATVPKKIIGVDQNKELLEKNSVVHEKFVANLENLPFENNSIDVIVSQFVLEHVENPEKVFKELFRVLKPGGVFIFLTPNMLNPVMALSKILPHFVHHFLRTTILKKQEETHPTYYKVNTHKKLVSLGHAAGFERHKIVRAGNPEYLGFCKPLVPLAIFYEKITDHAPLRFLKMYLTGYFVKDEANA